MSGDEIDPSEGRHGGGGMGGAQASGGYLGSVWGGLSEGKRVEARDGSEPVGANLVSCEAGLGQSRSLETEALGSWAWAVAKCRRSVLGGVSKIIYPTRLFYKRKPMPKKGKGLAQGDTRG